MNNVRRKAGIPAICLAALVTIQLLTVSSLGDDQFAAFQKWAVEHAIEQQKASKFQLTPYEEMDFYELYKLLRTPWDEKRTNLRNQLNEDTLDSDDEIWNQTMTEDDLTLMQLFRENLKRGDHCQAWIYHSLLYFDANRMTASQEAYDVYIKAYEMLYSQMEEFVAIEAVKPYDCIPCNGSSTSSRLYLTTDGVKEQDPDAVTRLYEGPAGPSDWPYFPVLQVVFGLSDGSEPPWESFVQGDVRYYDRTIGTEMRNHLDWMVSGWGVYKIILDRDGLEAAKEAFRNNLSIESDTYFIEFRDNASKNGVSVYKSEYGAVQMIKRNNFRKRCTPAEDEGMAAEE